MTQFSPEDVRLFIRFTERKIIGRAVGPGGHKLFEVPAAMARDENGKVLFFEEAVVANEASQAERFEWVEHAFFYKVLPLHLSFLLTRLFHRADVAALGSGQKYVLVCSSFRRSSANTSVFRNYVSFFDRTHILFTNEERLHSKGSEFSNGVVLNLTADFTNLVFRQERGYIIGPGLDTIVNSFIKMLCLKGYDLTDEDGQAFCRDLVLKYCYIAVDLESEVQLLERKGGVLHEIISPDGTTIELGRECFLTPECIFDPSLVGLSDAGVAAHFYELSERFQEGDEIPVLLCGYFIEGLVGFGERLQSETQKTLGNNIKIQLKTASSLEQAASMLKKSDFHPVG